MKCYVCGGEITDTQEYICIGKNKEGVELFRHKKCKPYGKLRKIRKIK